MPWSTRSLLARKPAGRGADRHARDLAQELQSSHRATIWTLLAMLVLSATSSGYLLTVSQPRVASYTELSRQARLVNEAMLDQETGLRGWLATGSEVFLTPYNRGERAAVQASDAMIEQAALSPTVTENTVRVLLRVQAWKGWADRAATWEPTQRDRIDGRLEEFLLEGKRLFDDYRVAQVENTDFAVTERDEALDAQRVALLTVTVATAMLLAAAATLAVRRGRHLKTAVLGPLACLLQTIDALRARDLTARADPSGIAELDDISSALGGLATEIQQADALALAREERLALLAARFETVVRVARETSGSLSTRYVSETVTSAASELLGKPTTLWVRSEEGHFLAVRRSQDPRGVVPPASVPVPALVTSAAADARLESDGASSAYPMVLAGMVIGVLEVEASDAGHDALQVLEALLSTAAAALESARMHGATRQLADLDALTQLPNRRRLEGDLTVEWDRSRRYGRPLTCLMIRLGPL